MCEITPRLDPVRFAKIATGLLDAGAMDVVCDALRDGNLTSTSTSVRRSAIAAGRNLVEDQLNSLHELWQNSPKLSSCVLALTLETVAESLRADRLRNVHTEVVWTGPRARTSYLRTTRQVVLDLVRKARSEVLIVGYWIVSSIDPDGILPQIIDGIADAAHHGARIRVILDIDARPGGKGNREQFLTLWPRDLDPPPFFTWQKAGSDEHLKLHAKVIVADRSDALVTSANLTMHAMDLNMEMGVRVLGEPAGAIADHFDRLIGQGILVPYGADE